MLFRKTRELEGLAKARAKSLKNAEDKTVDLKKQNQELYNERLSNIAKIYTYEEVFKEILEVIDQNSYGRTDRQKLSKIKELVTTVIN